MKKLNFTSFINKAYTEGIYSDTPQNRKLGRVGMSYKEYAEKIKEKKNYIVVTEDGESFIIDDKPISKDSIIEKVIQLCKDRLKNENLNKCYYKIEENIDWDSIPINEVENTKYEDLKVIAEKNGSNIDITVIDWNNKDNIYIRDDKKEREQKKFEKELKKKEEKSQKEFEAKYGWMKEALDLKKKEKVKDKKYTIQNDDNVLNIKLEGRVNGYKVDLGKVICFKEKEEGIYYLEEIFVNKDFRGLGFGEDLMKKFLEEAKKDKNFKIIELQVEAEETINYSNITEKEKIKKINHDLVKKFYSKFGFKYQTEEDKKERSPLLELKLKLK